MYTVDSGTQSLNASNKQPYISFTYYHVHYSRATINRIDQNIIMFVCACACVRLFMCVLPYMKLYLEQLKYFSYALHLNNKTIWTLSECGLHLRGRLLLVNIVHRSVFDLCQRMRIAYRTLLFRSSLSLGVVAQSLGVCVCMCVFDL